MKLVNVKLGKKATGVAIYDKMVVQQFFQKPIV